MSTANGQGTGGLEAVAGARPVVLLRYRPGVAGETSPIMRLMPLPLRGRETGAAGVALCGASPYLAQVEAVTPSESIPSSLCIISHVSPGPPLPPADIPASAPPADTTSSDSTPLAAADVYRIWGWPMTLPGDQVWLSLEPDTLALVIPVLLAEPVTAILNQRRCPPLMLAYPTPPSTGRCWRENRMG